MSSRAQSQRLATQLRDYEITAREKFPTWDDNARSYYAELKDKDRNGTLVSGSLNHYLYHTHLHKLREDRLQTTGGHEPESNVHRLSDRVRLATSEIHWLSVLNYNPSYYRNYYQVGPFV